MIFFFFLLTCNNLFRRTEILTSFHGTRVVPCIVAGDQVEFVVFGEFANNGLSVLVPHVNGAVGQSAGGDAAQRYCRLFF